MIKKSKLNGMQFCLDNMKAFYVNIDDMKRS